MGKEGCTERQQGGRAENGIVLEEQTGALSHRPSPRTELLKHDTLHDSNDEMRCTKRQAQWHKLGDNRRPIT